MSEAKADRTMAPRDGSRKSRAKQVKDRNITPPVARVVQPSKPKKGEKVMVTQLKNRPAVSDLGTKRMEPARRSVQPAAPAIIDVDSPPERDPWWTPERDKAYEFTLSGATQSSIARELGRDRHTIKIWQEDERFGARLQDENVDRFRASRQRRTIQTLRLTDKAHGLAEKMLDIADKNPKDLFSRYAARDWLSEFREQSRREDEIYGLDKQRVDVNVTGGIGVTHTSKSGAANVSFKEFLTTSMKKLGVDVDNEEVDPGRADEALIAVTERALMEGSFLEDLVEREKLEKLNPLVPNER